MRYLDQALEAYGKSDVYPFHMPGHKRNPLPFPEVYGIDITEIDGFDNLHHAEGILKGAQQRAADLYGSAQWQHLRDSCINLCSSEKTGQDSGSQK